LVAVQIPGYEIVSILGRGGMGTVYKGRQLSMDRPVAVKVLSDELSRDPAFATRFIREARALAKLSHPNIVAAIDAGEKSGTYYYVMEYVEGTAVSTLLRQNGRIPEKRALEIAAEAAQGLGHAHRNGMIHRDVKPENLLVQKDGRVRLCDFGLAKAQDRAESQGATLASSFLGTPLYASPEQARNDRDIDARTDLYSLGATLYHMLTGQPPFTGNTAMDIMAKHLTENPLPLRRRAPEISETTSRLVMKLLSKDRANRHANAEELIGELQRAMKSSLAVPPAARPTRTSLRAPEPRRSSSAVWVAAAIVGVVVIGVAVLISASGGPKPAPRPVNPPVAEDPGPAPAPSPLPPTPAESGEAKFKKEHEAFTQYVRALWTSEAPDRVTGPYEKLQVLIRETKESSWKLKWEQELNSFMAQAEEQIAPVWTRTRSQAEIELSTEQWGKALNTLRQFPSELTAFTVDKPTRAGAELQKMRADLERRIQQRFDADAGSVAESTRNGDFDRAWATLQSMTLYIEDSRRDDLLRRKLELLEAQYESIMKGEPTAASVKRAQERMNQIAAREGAQSRVAARAQELAAAAPARLEKYLADLRARAENGLLPVRKHAEECLEKRDTSGARKLLVEFLFGEFKAALRSEGADIDALRPMLEAALVEDSGPVDKAIEAALRALQQSNPPLTEVLLLARAAALMEDLYVHALKGLQASRGTSSRFKTAKTPILKGVSRLDEVTPFTAPGILVAAEIKISGRKSMLLISGVGENSMDHEDVVAFAAWGYPGKPEAESIFQLKAALHYAYMKQWASSSAHLERVTDSIPGLEPLRERVRSEVAQAPARPPEPEPPKAEPPKPEPKLDPKKKPKAPKFPFKGKIKELPGGALEVLYDFSDESQLQDFETGSFFGQNGVLPEWKKDKTLRLEGQGQYSWKPPLEGDVAIEITFTSDNEGFGILLHGEGDNRTGYLSEIDFDTSIQYIKPLLNDNCIQLKLPIEMRGRPPDTVSTQGGMPVVKGQKMVAWARWRGGTLESGLGAKSTRGTDRKFTSGRAGLVLGKSNLTIHSIKITATPNADWLKAEREKE
jgi:serine/threonine protein kinase